MTALHDRLEEISRQIEDNSGASLGEIASAVDASRPHVRELLQRFERDGHVKQRLGYYMSVRPYRAHPEDLAGG